MATKHRPKAWEFEQNPYDSYETDMDDDLDEDLDDIGDLSRDFYSTEWEDPSGSEERFSTRRKIERRNDLKQLYSQFEEWDEFDLGTDW